MHTLPASLHTCSLNRLLAQRSAFQSSMEALRQPTIRVVAIIAEGVPEADTKELIAYARQHNKVLLGPATVGGVQVRLRPAVPRRRCSASTLRACGKRRVCTTAVVLLETQRPCGLQARLRIARPLGERASSSSPRLGSQQAMLPALAR